MNTPCILWTAQKLTKSGCGRCTVRGERKMVHHLAWEAAYGPIPDKLHVFHKCGVRNCINPDHLFLGAWVFNKTAQQRIRDGSYYESNSGCWLWMGSVNEGGYGRIRIGGTYAKLAHRVSYEAFVGQIPAGMDVLHHCDTPCCVRPDHLWIGTQADNTHDMDAKGRDRRSDCGVPGEKHHNAKLTWDAVRWMRFCYERMGWPRRLLAECNPNVSTSNVNLILSGKAWKDDGTSWR